jgi:hypothetical protein
LIPDNKLTEMEARCAAARAALDGMVSDVDCGHGGEREIVSTALGNIPLLLTHIREQGAELAERVAICPGCGPVSACDEDRCCLTCGDDIIVAADAHSAEMLIELAKDRDTVVEQRNAALHHAETAEREVGELRAALLNERSRTDRLLAGFWAYTSIVEEAMKDCHNAQLWGEFDYIERMDAQAKSLWEVRDEIAVDPLRASLTPTGAPNDR